MPIHNSSKNSTYTKTVNATPERNDWAVRYYNEANTPNVFVIGSNEYDKSRNSKNGELLAADMIEITQPNRSSWVYMRRKNDDIESDNVEAEVTMRPKTGRDTEFIHRRRNETELFDLHVPTAMTAPTDSIVAKSLEVAVEAAAIANAKAAAAAVVSDKTLSSADSLKNNIMGTSVSDYHSHTESLHGPCYNASTNTSHVFANSSRVELLMCNETVPQSKCSILRGLLLCICLNFTYANVVRFPRELDRFGTVFLIPYLILMLLIGLPLIILEVGLGQFLGQGAAHNWRVSPIFKGATAVSRFAAWLSTIWAGTHAVLSLEYIFSFLMNKLPFKECVENVVAKHTTGYAVTTLSGQACLQQTFLIPFWQNPLQFTLIVSGLIVIWSITMICSRNSKSLRRSLFIVGVSGVVLLIAVTILEVCNSLERSYFPEFWPIEYTRLLSSNVWFNALMQVLFCTNAGFGVLPTLTGKFLYKGDAVRTSIVYICFNLLVNAIAVTLFIVQFDMSITEGPVTELRSLTSIYDRLQYDKPLDELIFEVLSILLYGIMLLSTLVTMSICMYTSTRLIPRHPNFVVSLVALLITIISMAAPNLTIGRILDSRLIGTIVIVAIVFELIAVAWIYGAKNICTDLEFSVGRPISKVWLCCWFITPVLLTAVLLWWCTDDDQFDLLSEYMPRWAPILFVLAAICIFAFIQIFRQVEYNFFGMICEASKPAKEWGPADPLARHSWKNWRAVCSDTGTRDFTLRRRGTRDYTNSIKKGQFSSAGKKFGNKTNQTNWKSTTPGNSSPNYSGSMFGDSAIEEDMSVEKFPGISQQSIAMQFNENRSPSSRANATQRSNVIMQQAAQQVLKPIAASSNTQSQPIKQQLVKNNYKDPQRDVVYIRRLSDDGRHATRIEIKPSNEAIIYGGGGIRNPLGRTGTANTNLPDTHIKRSVSSSRIDRARSIDQNALRFKHFATDEMMERVNPEYWQHEQHSRNQYTTEL